MQQITREPSISWNFLKLIGNVCGKFKNLQILSLVKNQFNQLENACFKEFKTGIKQSNTLCETQGIHNFKALHQEELREIITPDEERESV